MKIGVVIHGPEVIDSGQAEVILDILSAKGEVTARLGGTMGRTAVIDAGLENRVDTSQRLKPSESIYKLSATSDVIFLLNHGKTTETGRAFGSIVISNLKDIGNKPIIQVERPGCQDGEIISWNTSACAHAMKMLSVLGMKMSERPIPIFIAAPVQIENDGQRTIRRISGVHVGENILVNGVVIGKAESEDIGIVVENGFVKSIEGGIVKVHGIEKLHDYENNIPIDIRTVWVKSGSLRRSDYTPRIGSGSGSDVGIGGKVVMIDHAAEHCFELADGAQLAVTVGDDTTSIAGDILYRLGIPIIGITDGDFDGLSHNTHIYPGSTILHLKSGYDDIVGRRISEELFSEKNAVMVDTYEAFERKVMDIAGDSIISFVHY